MLDVIVAVLVTVFVCLVLHVYYNEWMIERALKSKMALKEAEITTVVTNAIDEAFKRGRLSAIDDIKKLLPPKD